MAKNEGMWILGFAVLAVLILGQQNAGTTTTTTTTTSGPTVDLCKLVDGSASFTGQKMYVTGTALTTEYVRVIRQGSIKDLGQISLNSGTVSTTPNAKYKLYYGENSSTYYTNVEDYTAPCQDASDDKVGILCTIDTAPSITVFDEYGNVQSATANAQAIAASEQVDIEIQIKAAADKCYGNPGAPKKNAVCFDYDGGNFTSVKVNNAKSISAPYSISNAKATAKAESCYEFDLIADTGKIKLPITLKTVTGQNPGVNQNITISVEDIGFDLNQDTLEEIWGYEDESNNNLGATTAVTGTIYIS